MLYLIDTNILITPHRKSNPIDIHPTYWNKMSDKAKDYVRELKQLLDSGMEDIKELEKHVYAIPKDDTLSQKENAPLQRAFFKDVYNLLIGKDTGPRLSTFLWAVESKKIIKLLSL